MSSHVGANPWQVVVRRDTTEMWLQHDPVLGELEPALDTTTNTMRLGDGRHRFSELPVYRIIGEGTLTKAIGDWGGGALITKHHESSLVEHLVKILNADPVQEQA